MSKALRTILTDSTFLLEMVSVSEDNLKLKSMNKDVSRRKYQCSNIYNSQFHETYQLYIYYIVLYHYAHTLFSFMLLTITCNLLLL